MRSGTSKLRTTNVALGLVSHPMLHTHISVASVLVVVVISVDPGADIQRPHVRTFVETCMQGVPRNSWTPA